MILVTGAAGKTGRAVTAALAKRGAAVRAFVHRAEAVASLQALGATEVVIGDLRRYIDLQRAGQGSTAIYHICPNMQPDEVEIAEQVIAAAQGAGVTRFVYHSVLHPQTQAMPHHWQKLRVEELLFTTDLDYTILQPAAYMQNVLAGRERILAEGVYRVPYATTTRLGMVDLADVAEVAALVLTTPGHSGATYELAGGEWLTQVEVASILSAVWGLPVRAERQPCAAWEEFVRSAGLSDYAIATLRSMFDYYERYGFCGNPHVLRWLLNRPPTSFAECMKRTITE
ncbi:MAG: NmrA family NAD(P)-binding protein [Caldilineaceae bacterium]